MKALLCAVLGVLIGTLACGPTQISIGNADLKPPKEYPSSIYVELSDDKGSHSRQGGGDAFVQLDPNTKILAVYVIDEDAAPLGPKCDFSSVNKITKGGYTLFHVPGASKGVAAKYPVSDAQLTNRGMLALDTSSPLDRVMMAIIKYDDSHFEGVLMSADDSKTRTHGKIVAEVCPDLAK